MGVSEKVAREDAIRLARRHYLARERIDMQSIASELGIGRTTLYRWVGDRDNLISEMLSGMVVEVIRETAQDAKGRDIDRVIDGMRRFMETSARFEPLRHLVQTEPELGLRVMLAPGSGVSRAIRAELRSVIEEARPGWSEEKVEEISDVLTQVGMAYEWGNIAVRSEPEIERALRAMELVLRSADAA
jgi:AcrR family transcriptional regulator